MPPADIVLMVVVFAIAISVHESSHAYVAFRCGDSTAKRQGRISMNPLDHIDIFGTVIFPFLLIISGVPPFGWARPVPVNPSRLKNPRRDQAYVSAAGPASNFMLAIISVLLYVIFFPLLSTESFTLSEPLRKMLIYNTVINVALAIFNLLPIPPLDGGGILKYFLKPRQVRWVEQNQMILFGLLIVLYVTNILHAIMGLFRNLIFSFQTLLIQLIWI